MFPKCFRALRGSCRTCSRALRNSFPTCSHALRASCPIYSRVPRALCFTSSHMWPHASRFMSPFFLTCFVPHILSCPTCFVFHLEPYVAWCLALYEPFFPYLPNCHVTYVLYVLITPIYAPIFLFNCYLWFLGEFTKVKTNIVWSDDQYLSKVWFILIFWNQIRKHIHTKPQIILVQVKANLKLNIIFTESCSQRIKVIHSLSNTFGT